MKVFRLVACGAAIWAGGANTLYLTKKKASPAVVSLPLQIRNGLSGDALSWRDRVAARSLYTQINRNVSLFSLSLKLNQNLI